MRLGLRMSAAILVIMAAAVGGCGTTEPDQSSDAQVESPDSADSPFVPTRQVLDAVKAAQSAQVVPDAVVNKLTDYDKIQLVPRGGCNAVDNTSDAAQYGNCEYGDPNGKKLMVVYGDSHADMWASSLARVAAKSGWRLRVFAKHACPAPNMRFQNPETQTPDDKCDTFHSVAPDAVKALHPDLVIVTSKSQWLLADGSPPAAGQWRDAWVTTIKQLATPGMKLVMLGDLPSWPNNTPRCLAAHLKDLQSCSAPVSDAASPRADTERAAADATGTLYVPTVQWVCAERCEPIVADTRVFSDPTHITSTYAAYLSGPMAEALHSVLSQ